MLEGSMHSLMTSILAGFTRLNPFRANAESNPPFRQLADSPESQRGERRTIVSTYGLRQAIRAKRPLKPWANRGITGVFQSPTDQQIAREVVGQCQWVAPPMVTQNKVPFEICTPDLIGSLAVAKWLAVGADMASLDSGLNQADSLKDGTPSGSAVQ